MKKLSLLIALVIMSTGVFAQANAKYYSAGSMIGGAGLNFSAFGLGFGANFEYGITDMFGIQAAINKNSYESGIQKWSLIPIDLYATWHNNAFNSGFMSGDMVDTYAMLGATWTTYSVDDGSKDESASGVGFGGGIGSRYYFNDHMSLGFEGKYRFASFEAGGYSLALAWYSIGLNFGYKL